jgi:hypothetical protein
MAYLTGVSTQEYNTCHEMGATCQPTYLPTYLGTSPFEADISQF